MKFVLLKKYLYVTLLLIVLLLPFISHAEGINTTYTPLVEIPGLTTGNTTNADIGPYISGMYKWAISLSIALAVIMFTFHAFGYLLSESTVTSKSKAKEGMQNVIIGLILIFSAYLILKTINPKLVELGFSVELPADNNITGSQTPSTSGPCGGSAVPIPTAPGIYIQTSPACMGSNNIVGKTVAYIPYTKTASMEQCKLAAAALPAKSQKASCLKISNLYVVSANFVLLRNLTLPKGEQKRKFWPDNANAGYETMELCNIAKNGTGFTSWANAQCSIFMNITRPKRGGGLEKEYLECRVERTSGTFCAGSGGTRSEK